MFELNYKPFSISSGMEAWKIALIPWDTETFGFRISDLQTATPEDPTVTATLLRAALGKYCQENQVQLITTTVSKEEKIISRLLQEVGFYFIDLSMTVKYEHLEFISAAGLDGFSLAPATSEEFEILLKLSGTVFKHGRYHQDPLFSRSLADKRYQDWLRRTQCPDSEQLLLTARINRDICGFSIVGYKGSEGYLHLNAIDPRWQGKHAGLRLISQSLAFLREKGATTVFSKISACNLAAVNLHSFLKARFVNPQLLFHRHSANKFDKEHCE
jgi:hypothetical protein